MAFESSMIDNFDCRHVVVVRWNQSDTTDAIPAPRAIVAFIETVGYALGNKDRNTHSPNPKHPEQFIILHMDTADEAKRISADSVTKGFGINNTVITINQLIGVNGIRLRDVADFVRSSQDNFANNEMLDLIMITIRLELPERLRVIEKGYNMIKRGISELIEDASCEMFGSFPSKVRRIGYSDIDINIESNGTAENVRSLKNLLTNPKLLIESKLTKAELKSYPPEETVKILFHCFHENDAFRKEFEIRYVPARTPILVFKSINENGLNMSYDVSVCNQKGVDKANLLDEFIIKDMTTDHRMKHIMIFIVHWARSNKLLSGAYPEEKLKTKTNLNSYIFNQLTIHFVQAFASKVLVQPQAKYGSRVEQYDFNAIFGDVNKFLKEYFKYYASFDFTNKAIYGKQAMQKTTLSNVHGAKITPLMIMDPMDCTHNISAKVTEEAVKMLNGLIRNALYIIKHKPFHINQLLETNYTAVEMMKSKETKIKMESSVVDGVEHHTMTVSLPEVVQTAADLMLLLTRVLRFDVSPNYEGPSVTDLNNEQGVTFTVQAKTWIGRRNKKRQLKNIHNDLTPLQLDVMSSDTFQYEDQPVAELRVCVPTTAGVRCANIAILKGNPNEVRDALHFLMDQFVLNNLEALMEHGIKSIANIPVMEPTS